ncbi:MAG: rhodanese-like domain-containing protein [Clostridiales bacterium]|nr:rhodanese-like domain-containing protein [Candidatus Crickella merdequi]
MILNISFEEAKQLLDSLDNIVMIDVREESEYITGHAVGAELLPMSEICVERAAELIPSKSTPVIVYCRSGRRSMKAARLLEDWGYESIYDVGGLAGWPYGLEY